jgi:hypothetical protein
MRRNRLSPMELPDAVISVDQKKRAHICAWCKDKDEAETWCQTQNLTVTHGICPRCQENLLQPKDFTKL